MSKLTLKNNNQEEFTITHNTSGAKDISSKDITQAVDTVADMEAIVSPHDGQVVIVRDSGIYIYDGISTWVSKVSWIGA